MDKLLTVEQASDKLHLSPYTVREYLRKGMIHGCKLGKAWRIIESDLENFIKSEVSSQTTARISARGAFAHVPGSVDEFLREKHEEFEREERMWEEKRRK